MMRRLLFTFLSLLLLAGCAAAPLPVVATPTAPPSTLQTVSSSAICSLVAHHVQYGTVSDDQLVLYAQSLYSKSDLDDASFVSVRDIRVDGPALLVFYDSCPGLASIFFSSSDDAATQASVDDVLSSFRAYFSEMSSIFRDACIDMGREELDSVVLLMSDEDSSVPLMGAINGVIWYDASVDDPASAFFDSSSYPVLALAAAIGVQAADHSDDDFFVSDLRVHDDLIVLDISTPNGLRAYVNATDPENVPSWKTYRRVFSNFTRSAHDYCASRGREDVSVIVRVLNCAEPVDALIVARDGEITSDNTLWRTIDGWYSLQGGAVG